MTTKKPEPAFDVPGESGTTAPEGAPQRRAYSPPRLERKRAVERVTLLSGMGAMGVGVVNMMN